MAAEIEKEIGSESVLVRGDNGIFDVLVDDQLIFSKHEVNRFPESGEVLAKIQTRH